MTCAHCNVSYHEECYAANGACTTFGCPGWAQRPLGGASLEENPVAAATLPQGRIAISLDDTAAEAPVPEPVPSQSPVMAGIAPDPVTPEPVVAFCDQCGTPVAPGDQFCAVCGHALGAL